MGESVGKSLRMKLTWYKVVKASSLKDLEKDVNTVMSWHAGWKPEGGISITNDLGVAYHQVLWRTSGKKNGMKGIDKRTVEYKDAMKIQDKAKREAVLSRLEYNE